VGRKSWISLAVLAVVAAVWSSCGGEETTPSELTTPVEDARAPVETAEGTAEMVVDAVSGGEVNASAEVQGTSPLEVDINILGATIGYQGYQYYLEWNPELLAFDGHTDLKPAGLDLCATPTTSADRVAAGCISVAETTMFAGPVSTITFHCISNGTGPLHLVTSGESPASFSTTMAPRGVIIPTELTDASVTCLGP